MTCIRTSTIALLVLTVLLTASLSATGAPGLDMVRVSFQPFQTNSGLFIAEHEGYFAAQRIKITWVPFAFPEQFIPVLAQGQLDVGASAITPAFFNAVAAGEKLRVVAAKGHVGGKGNTGSLVVRRGLAGTVRTIQDLKGRKLATASIGSFAHYVLAKALANGGVSPSQVTVVHMPLPAAAAALQTGAVDAAVLPLPLDAAVVENGIAFRLMDFGDIVPEEPTGFIIYGPTLEEQNRALGTRFMIAYLRGMRRYNEGPTARNVAIIAEYLKVSPEIVRKGWAGIHPDGFVDVVRMRRFQDWLFDLGLTAVRNPMSTVIDLAFLEDAREALGVSER